MDAAEMAIANPRQSVLTMAVTALKTTATTNVLVPLRPQAVGVHPAHVAFKDRTRCMEGKEDYNLQFTDMKLLFIKLFSRTNHQY